MMTLMGLVKVTEVKLIFPSVPLIVGVEVPVTVPGAVRSPVCVHVPENVTVPVTVKVAVPVLLVGVAPRLAAVDAAMMKD
jgi:hypothetical protein